jgi:hypothetical protein
MKKGSRTLLTLGLFVTLLSCRTDPTGPDSRHALILATLADSTLVNVAGVFDLTTRPDTDQRLVLSSGGARFYAGRELQYRADVIRNRSIIVKRNGLEGVRSIYDLVLVDDNTYDFDNRYFQLVVESADSLVINDCLPESEASIFNGRYIRSE